MLLNLWPITQVVNGEMSQQQYEDKAQELVKDWVFEMVADRRITVTQLKLMLETEYVKYK